MAKRPFAPALRSYDRRQLSLIRRILVESLKQVDFMAEPGRSQVDQELRAMHVSGSTAFVSILAKNYARRAKKPQNENLPHG